MKKTILLIIILIFLSFTVNAALTIPEGVEKLEYRIINTYPHDTKAFTQGFEIYNNNLYESTGLYGRSSLRKVEIKSGKIINKINLADKYFGEGITILDNKIYQLSWKENTGFVYDLNFNLINSFDYKGEGWGLTNDGKNLIMSNGSKYLYYRDRESFELIKKLKVEYNGQTINNINELEYLNGYIYANIWLTDYIIKIDAETGEITAFLDFENILNIEEYEKEVDVLNGIAYDPAEDNFLITGKLWPKVFRIEIIK